MPITCAEMVKAIMFWKSNTNEPHRLRVVKKNELTIKTKDGVTLSWAVDNWTGTKRIEPWKEFYKWFFGRTGELFVMHYNDGETMFRRSDIVRFTVHVYTNIVYD